jgi:hypothetical protein
MEPGWLNENNGSIRETGTVLVLKSLANSDMPVAMRDAVKLATHSVWKSRERAEGQVKNCNIFFACLRL